MGSEQTHGPAGSEIQRAARIISESPEFARPNESDANDLGALALFGSEAESGTEPGAVVREPSAPAEDPVRNLRTRLAVDSRPGASRRLLRGAAALKLAVGDYASTVRALLAPRLREYLVRHPKLPAQGSLIACIVVAAVITGHYVGRIDVVRIDEAPSQPTSPARVASEPLTVEPIQPTPRPAVQRQLADRRTDARAQLPPAPKAAAPKAPAPNATAPKAPAPKATALKAPAPNATAPKAPAPKPQRSMIDINNSTSRTRRAENPRPREIGREAPTAVRTGAADKVIAPPPSVSAVAPVVPASVRPTATSPAPAPVQAPSANNVDYESSGRIYSVQDVDVRPPQMLEADLPRPAVTNWPTIKNSMELLVTEDGSVERVKWLTTRERMPDVMLLSRAKLWKFSPALKDGRPVRYRLIVTWEVNP